MRSWSGMANSLPPRRIGVKSKERPLYDGGLSHIRHKPAKRRCVKAFTKRFKSGGECVSRRLTRRRFICHTIAGVATASGAARLSSFAAAKIEARPAWRCRLSTSSIHFNGLSLEQACARIAALGFEAVDIWSAYDNCPHLDDAANRLGPDGLKALLARHRLQLCSFSVYVGGYVKYAELLGGVGGGVAIQGSAPPCKPAELTAKMRAFLESLKPLIELAERHHSRLAIENHGNVQGAISSFCLKLI